VKDLIAMALDPSLILKARGMDVDPWQRNLLLSTDKQLLLNCCRQSGKSTTVSALALHTAIFTLEIGTGVDYAGVSAPRHTRGSWIIVSHRVT
jgi:hypothetical protein